MSALTAERSTAAATQASVRWVAWMALLVLGATLVIFPRLTSPGLFDNEGRYAEVAREMLATGDWVTPHMNGEVFLNKPPLTFWLVAVVFRVAGPTEGARLVSVLAVLSTAGLLFAIGRRLWNAEAGLWAGAVFLTALMTPVEAGFLRPDSLLTCFLALSLWGFLAARDGDAPAVGLVALWGGMGLGVMTKGLLGVFLPAIVLIPALALGGEIPHWRRYVPWWGPVLTGAIALPWHVAVGLRNEGFWWDYVVNQHLLFFLHRKFPRDSRPIALWLAWASVAVRLLPWVFALPAALVWSGRGARERGGGAAWLPVCWFGCIFVFFSASQGRLEQHFLPAIPGAALAIGGLLARWTSESVVGSRGGRLLPFAAVLGLGGVAAALAPTLIRGAGVGEVGPRLQAAALAAMLLLAGAGLWGLLLAAAGRWRAALGGMTALLLAMGVAARAGVRSVGPLVSARELFQRIPAGLAGESELAYEAGEEYQLCGVLNYYSGRYLQLLEPPGFIPPTYLKQDVSRLFVKRGPFFRDWAAGKRRYLLFTDPEKAPDRPADFPHPYYEVARGGGRALLTNLPLPGARATRGQP